MNATRRLLVTLAAALLGGGALAFCGFYLAKADADLFNSASKVIVARDGDRQILSMANDFRGDVQDFALVVPVPVVLDENQVQVGDPAVFDRLDAYSAPRLVEYHDGDPCATYDELDAPLDFALPSAVQERGGGADALGVTVEAQFTVGEYDIAILSAEESAGLETWLTRNGYLLPTGVRPILARYLDEGMKFFVARVNLDAFARTGSQFLRPLVMAFETDSFMLPIRLGMVNADGPQELIAFMLSPEGRVEVANYPTLLIPSDVTLPEFVEDDFGEVYRAIFRRAHEVQEGRAVFVEYAWDMRWCDPCAADPLSADELLRAGVFWLDDPTAAAPDVYLTRLHARYTAETFPEDLQFRQTRDRDNFQGRYILQRPYRGAIRCEAGRDYIAQVGTRQAAEAATLADLTGWDLASIRARQEAYRPEVEIPTFWERVFDRLRSR